MDYFFNNPEAFLPPGSHGYDDNLPELVSSSSGSSQVSIHNYKIFRVSEKNNRLGFRAPTRYSNMRTQTQPCTKRQTKVGVPSTSTTL